MTHERRGCEDPLLEIVQGAFSMENPWQLPSGAAGVPLVNSSNGQRPRLETNVNIYHDGARIYFVFDGADDQVVTTHLARDSPVWKEDAVEIFLSPFDLRHYFEIEVSPRGTLFDAMIHSPDGRRETMEVDRDWNCGDLFAAVRYEREIDVDARFTTVIAVPFVCLDVAVPLPGKRWRANFFRIDRHPGGDEFTAWRPTGRTPPDFHVPAAFGELLFR